MTQLFETKRRLRTCKVLLNWSLTEFSLTFRQHPRELLFSAKRGLVALTPFRKLFCLQQKLTYIDDFLSSQMSSLCGAEYSSIETLNHPRLWPSNWGPCKIKASKPRPRNKIISIFCSIVALYQIANQLVEFFFLIKIK